MNDPKCNGVARHTDCRTGAEVPIKDRYDTDDKLKMHTYVLIL